MRKDTNESHGANETEAGDDQYKELYKTLSNAVGYVSNECIVLSQYERIQPDRFPHLWSSQPDEAFDNRMNSIVEHLGAPPRLYIVREGDNIEPQPSDNYPETAIDEVFAVFSRARKSILRSHMFMIGSGLLAKEPTILNLHDNQQASDAVLRLSLEAFWEHAEAAYIRMCSFWDRIGQVLDFAFFNIRKFDHNGFNSVMKRIHDNAVPMNEQLNRSASWRRLRLFQNSAKDDGLQWLLERRNLIVHSLHLHPIPVVEEEGVFRAQFNHLDEAHRKRLVPRSPAAETEILIGQLVKACELFNDVLTVVELSPSRKVDCWVR